MSRQVCFAGMLCLLMLGACNVNQTTSPSVTPSSKQEVARGTETWTPSELKPADGGTPVGPTGPALTDVACSGVGSCAPWFCECENKKVVNAGFCYQNFCTQAGEICPRACDAFKFGKWTGNYGGGPKKPEPETPKPVEGGCSTREDCPRITCECVDGAQLSVRECLNRVCGVESTSCESACVDSGHEGWAGN